MTASSNSLLVTKMMVERTARQAGNRREIIHRSIRIANRAERMARGAISFGAGLGNHRRAWLAGHPSPSLTYGAYVN